MTKVILSCDDCLYVSTMKHFRDDDGSLSCMLCHGENLKKV